MCGIAGIIFLKPNLTLEVSHLQQMTSTVRNRGPDDEGYVLFENMDLNPHIFCGIDTPQDVFASDTPFAPFEQISGIFDLKSFKVVLAHRRLSIIDLSSSGHQPMCYDNQRYWITYNGEIYNWKELRNELETLGHTFVSHTDTEVILASYAQWGKECLQRFNGMWAFVIFDRKSGTLFAARDRFGVKPLYYWISSQGYVAFASEIKQFTVLPGWQAMLNNPRAYDYLVSGTIDHTSETLFFGVFQIRGGQAVQFNIEDISTKLPVYQWYKLRYKDDNCTFDEASNKLRELLTDSVRLRLRADVPVGSCLSGGLDSSSIVVLVNNILKKETNYAKQKTFSACSEIKKFDEREFIDEVVKNYAIEAYYTYPSVEVFFQNLESIIWHQDEPFSSMNIYAQWQVFQLASQNNVKVMLDGQGADEQLCGYYGFIGAREADLLRDFKWITLIKEINSVKKIHKFSFKNSIMRISKFILPNKWRDFLLIIAKKELISPSWLNMEKIKNTHETEFYQGSSFIQKESYSQLIYTNLPLLLHWEDRNSMAHSVESRVPFLDYRLVEFIFNLPDEFKISEGITKKIFRESMKGILPERIRTRMDKMGFVTTDEYWVTKEKPDHFRQMLIDSIEFSQGIIKNNAISLLDNTINGKIQYSWTIWRLICFGRWMKVFNVNIMN